MCNQLAFKRNHQVNRVKLNHKIRVVNADEQKTKLEGYTHVEMKMRMERNTGKTGFRNHRIGGTRYFLGYDWFNIIIRDQLEKQEQSVSPDVQTFAMD